jgi:hypothetical protein
MSYRNRDYATSFAGTLISALLGKPHRTDPLRNTRQGPAPHWRRHLSLSRRIGQFGPLRRQRHLGERLTAARSHRLHSDLPAHELWRAVHRQGADRANAQLIAAKSSSPLAVGNERELSYRGTLNGMSTAKRTMPVAIDEDPVAELERTDKAPSNQGSEVVRVRSSADGAIGS